MTEVIHRPVDHPPGPDALIEEARHRQRRRRTWIALVLSSVVAIGSLVFVLSGGSSQKPPSIGSHAFPPAPAVIAHWTPLNTATGGLPPGAQINSLVKFDGNVVAAGQYLSGAGPVAPGYPSAAGPVVWSSPDGTTWTKVWDAGGVVLGTGTGMTLVRAPGRLLLFNGGTAGSALWSSTDAVHWTRVGLPDAMAALAVGGAIWGHGLYVVLLSNKFIGGPVTAFGDSDTVWTSSDGTHWQLSALGPPAYLGSIVSTTTGFLIGGQVLGTSKAMTWSSNDATHWSASPLGDQRGQVTVATDMNTWVATVTTPIRNAPNPFGYTSTTTSFWWSRPGTKWTRALGPQPGRLSPSPRFVTEALPSGFMSIGAFDAMPVWFSTTGRSWARATNTGAPHTPILTIVPEENGFMAFTQTWGPTSNSPLEPRWWRVLLSA